MAGIAALGAIAAVEGKPPELFELDSDQRNVATWFSALLLVEIHESLQEGLGLYWQRIYVPVILAAGIVWLLTLRSLRHTLARALFLSAGGAWLVSQVLEYIAWGNWPGGVRRGYLAATEELLEMTGSALFVLALLVWLRQSDRGFPRGVSSRPEPRS